MKTLDHCKGKYTLPMIDEILPAHSSITLDSMLMRFKAKVKMKVVFGLKLTSVNLFVFV